MLDLKANIGVSELAGLLRLTERTISDLVRRQVLTKRGRGFRLDEAIGAYAEHVRTRAAGNRPSPAVEARARLLEIQAQRAEVELAERRGELLVKRDVMAEHVQVFREIRSRLLALPDRLAGRCGLDRVAVALADEEVREVLTELGNPDSYRLEIDHPGVVIAKPRKRGRRQ
jgi:phage terminase Nu1 subunit (DNA packaging protein)